MAWSGVGLPENGTPILLVPDGEISKVSGERVVIA